MDLDYGSAWGSWVSTVEVISGVEWRHSHRHYETVKTLYIPDEDQTLKVFSETRWISPSLSNSPLWGEFHVVTWHSVNLSIYMFSM